MSLIIGKSKPEVPSHSNLNSDVYFWVLGGTMKPIS